MILKSFGCSYIFGSELADDGRNKLYATGSRLTWPALVAQHYGHQYNTYARPGSGNQQILERLSSNLAGSVNDSTICVIGWTWTDRFDYCVKTTSWPGMPWATIMPTNTTEAARIYYRDLHSEIQDKFLNLLYIRRAIDLLKEKSIPFIMTYMDSLLFDTRWHTTPAITEMQAYIQPYMTTFEGLNFQDWSRRNKYPISEIGHPLEQAHKGAADYIIQVFDKKSIGDHCHLS
jgi:hypothetical protein